MKFKFIWVGRTKCNYLQKGIKDYLKRINRYVQVELKEIKEEPIKGRPLEIIKAREAARIKAAFGNNEFRIALDERGRQLSTLDLSETLKRLPQRGYKTICFFVGGPVGLNPQLIKQADFCLSLSLLTMPHEIVRLVLLEQLYRILTIWHGEKYHK